jgi:hypothetical protein
VIFFFLANFFGTLATEKKEGDCNNYKGFFGLQNDPLSSHYEGLFLYFFIYFP